MFSELQELIGRSLPIQARYDQLYRILVASLNEKTRDLTIEFSGPFARLDYLCRQLQYRDRHPQAYRQICAFRGRCMHLRSYTPVELEGTWGIDVRAMCEFLQQLYGVAVPDGLRPFLAIDYPEAAVREVLSDYLRCSVDRIDEAGIYLVGPLGEALTLPWRYALSPQQGKDLTYLRPMLKPGAQLNLVRPWVEAEELRAQQVVFEPDLLIDISTIASCFAQSGASAYHYLFHLLDTTPRTGAQLLGNLAGQMLDEEVHHLGATEAVSYTESLTRFFADNALSVVTCSDFLIPDLQRKFHEQARQQQLNIRQLVRRAFAEDRTIDLQKVVLEPSFYCEMLGVQGRMDLLQSDKHVLMEQKSGKMDEYRHTHVRTHFVQVLLYQAMLHYAYSDELGRFLRNDDISTYLLYSRYPDGLLKEAPAPRLLDEAIQIRNQIAYLQLLISRGEARHIFDHLTPDHLNTEHLTGRLWEEYIRPRLDETLHTLHHATDLEQDYFYRMMTFVAREHILTRVGTSRKEASGFSALWNCTPVEKREAGDLMDNLCITDVSADNAQITLSVGQTDELVLPNFRIGDIVVLYSYPFDKEPDARRDLVFRASIVDFSSETLVLRLRAPQTNLSLFHPEGEVRWAVEHDHMESSSNGLYRALYAFLQATPDRRALILGQRPPAVDATLTLTGDYGDFNSLVLRAKQAQDYFLLVGPPGTGKTSCGLVNILTEELSGEGSCLLVSYTNRAVDEICSKLVQMGEPFLRIGSELSCAPEFRPYLLSERCRQCHTAQEIRNLIQGSRVVVGTTTAMSSGLSLFELKPFDLCIIDEASQILEPHLLALLCARHRDENAIRRFIMIGDHKQLPAVVQQTDEESAVVEPRLQAIGLMNCRQSLFERLIRTSPDHIYTLTAQGRMHHEVALFPNLAFYGNQLREVPLPHQLRPVPYRTESDDADLQLLCQRRISFLNIIKKQQPDLLVSDKVNYQEAERIAKLVHAAWLLYQENGLTFDASMSVGVIVPYRHQISTIRKHLEPFGIPELMQISIDTVERYQGSQRDIIIYGFTICRPYQLDFLTSNRFVEADHIIDRKLNVAMTRAREIMILVGDAEILSKDPVFASLLEYIGNLR